jgi:Zn-dependent protease
MPEYYKVDNRKLTLREYWNIGRSWKAFLAWGMARLGTPMESGVGFSMPETVSEMEIAESDVSDYARAKLQPLLEQCTQLGFHSPRHYLHESIRRDVRTFFISMLHRSGEFTLRLMHTRAANGPVPVENILAVLLSELNDGTFFFTSDQREKLKVPPGVSNNRLVGGNPLQLIESHQKKLVQLGMRNPPRPVPSKEAMDDVWNRYEKVGRDFQVGRGLYIPMSLAEVEGQQKLNQSAQTMTSDGVRHAEVLVELGQLQNKKAGWGSAIWIFLVSMLLFLGAGSQQWSWKYVLILVPVLFIHELGHYIAMRAFNYRNLRMFFIPFVGAAVSGRHYNVAGWKKVIVSMMGPVPGIVLGVIVGSAGLVLHQPILITVALVTLVLNGINLLPVLPLDGGWIFHNLLFSRHYMLDAGFRVVAVIALMLGGMFTKDKILMYLSIPMLIGIPAAYRLARTTQTLRERGISPSSADDQTVPPETAAAIIDEMQKNLPRGHTNKMVAQQTLQIFELLNARPPSWLATGALLFAYIASLGMAIVFAGVLVVGERGNARNLFSNALSQPKTPLVCGSILSWRGTQAAPISGTVPMMMVADFPNRSKAEKAFLGLTNRLPESATAKVFGNVLFLTFSSAETGLRKQWFAELQTLSKTVFVESSNTFTTFSISCQLPTEKQAEAIKDELNEYLGASVAWHLIPPWQPNDSRTSEQRAAHQLARRSFREARSVQSTDFKDPKMRALQKQMSQARRQGDDAEVAALSQKMESLSTELAQQKLKNLKTGKEGAWDPAIIDLYAAWLASAVATNREGDSNVMQQMALRMGQLPEKAPAEDQFSLRTGYVSSEGQKLQLGWLSFVRLADGAPALLDWLCTKGAGDVKYEMISGTGSDDDQQ